MTLEWKPLDDENCSITKCGRYAVSTCGGTWQAWRLAPGGPWFAPLDLKLPDEQSAKQRAEGDCQ